MTLSTSAHTNGLSRHSSRSTTNTASRRVSLPTTTTTTTSSFASHLTRLLKKFGSSHHREQRLPNRTLSTSTVRTHVSSWSQVRVANNKKERSITFSNIKRKKSLQSQVSAPMVGLHRRVQLTRRPTLTVGTVEFIGHVNFADGVWIGVELDRRGM